MNVYGKSSYYTSDSINILFNNKAADGEEQSISIGIDMSINNKEQREKLFDILRKKLKQLEELSTT
tara:strand:- start:591 stop:788 length:198 start_codon:yes stop_codon:yes gene_type:complete